MFLKTEHQRGDAVFEELTAVYNLARQNEVPVLIKPSCQLLS